MKKKIAVSILTGLCACFMSAAFSACGDKSYTKSQTDDLIAELQTTIDGNKGELDAKINALSEEYKAKENELRAQIAVNQQSIAAIQTEYAVKLATLELAGKTTGSSSLPSKLGIKSTVCLSRSLSISEASLESLASV